MKAGKTSIYKKWKERSHRQISLDGRATNDVSEEGTSHAGDAILLAMIVSLSYLNISMSI